MNQSNGKKLYLIKLGGAIVSNSSKLEKFTRGISRIMSGNRAKVCLVHGAGPQLNETLQKRYGLSGNYLDGIRVTDKSTLKIAYDCFVQENSKLCAALNRANISAHPIVPDLKSRYPMPLIADFWNKEKYGWVGKITDVDISSRDSFKSLVQHKGNNNAVPVMCSIASMSNNALKQMSCDEANDSQFLPLLNVNADTAAAELAKSLSPSSVIFLSGGGGMKHPVSKSLMNVIEVPAPEINPSTDYIKDDIANGIYQQENLISHFEKLPEKGSLVKLNEVTNLMKYMYEREAKKEKPGSDMEAIICSVEDLPKYALENQSTANISGTVLKFRKQSSDTQMEKKPQKIRIGSQKRFFSTQGGEHLKKRKLALIGARGHTGQEILRILNHHPIFDLSFISSRELAGKSVEIQKCHFSGNPSKMDAGIDYSHIIPGTNTKSSVSTSTEVIKYQNYSPDQIGTLCAYGEIDAVILALPNNVGGKFVEAIEKNVSNSSDYPSIVDLSADQRFHHDSSKWIYGLPELYDTRDLIRKRIHDKKAVWISNPGCYATSAQFSLYPFYKAGLIDNKSDDTEGSDNGGIPRIFGVSGYSGAGTTPSKKNDIQFVANNIIPYSPIGHLHEKEVGWQLRRARNSEWPSMPVHFMPHVGGFFRGLMTTVDIPLQKKVSPEDVKQLFKDIYRNERLVKLLLDEKADLGVDGYPGPKNVAELHECWIGGFQVSSDGKRAVMVSAIDNLLKGAATQAIQNLNLSFELAEYMGIGLSD